MSKPIIVGYDPTTSRWGADQLRRRGRPLHRSAADRRLRLGRG